MGSVETRSCCHEKLVIFYFPPSFPFFLPLPFSIAPAILPSTPLSTPAMFLKSLRMRDGNVCMYCVVDVSGYFKRHLARLCVV